MAQSKSKAPATGLEKVVQLRDEGDFHAARSLVEKILTEPGLSEPARVEANAVLATLKVDRGALLVGGVMVAVLAVLYAFVIARGA